MLISVIIPAYNARKFIGSMLESLVAQHFKDMEVVIADDCLDKIKRGDFLGGAK
jgi:glycosyltransferase involved in cell wall biosynthesis